MVDSCLAQSADDALSELSLIQLLELNATQIGSRRQARSSLESSVPIDVLERKDLTVAQGDTNTLDVISTVIPSFNVGREPISDAATLVRPYNLRGLPSDSTLVLINGKRRHKSAIIGEFTAGLNKGAQPTDLVPLFPFGLKRVAFLNDGAAAQYGSDAIAGVMNITLLDDSEIAELSVQSAHYGLEGEQGFTVNGAFGTQLGVGGFGTFAFEYKTAEATSRGSQDPQATALIDAGNTSVANPVVIWGNPEIDTDIKTLFNAALEAGDRTLYVFGNWALRDVEGSFFYRNPNNRSGVFTGSNRPDDRLVLDLDLTDSEDCSTVAVAADGTIDDPNALTNKLRPADGACFVFNQIFPGGFTPRFGGRVVDASLVAGLRSDRGDGGMRDVSVSIGRHAVDYKIRNTVNPSYGPASPLAFELGGQIEFETLVNYDVSRPLDVGMASDLNLAYGVQYHREHFQMVAGETESWLPGGFESQGTSTGANGFQGFSADFSGKFDRDSVGAYIDFEVDLTERLLTNLAFRYENFSDFGNTFDSKFSALYRVSHTLSLRGGASSGFRAPSIGQSNLQRSATSFDNGQLTSSLTLPPTSEALQALSDPIIIDQYNAANGLSGTDAVAVLDVAPLQPEEANNISFGGIFQFNSMALTIDYYRIDVDDRIALRGNIAVSAAQREILATNGGIRDTTVLNSIAFFTNSFDSVTQGLDVVLTKNFNLGLDAYGLLSVKYNYNHTEINAFDPSFVQDGAGQALSVSRQNNLLNELERGVPDHRMVFSYGHYLKKWQGFVRANFYGKTFELLLNEPSADVETDPLLVFDVESTWLFGAGDLGLGEMRRGGAEGRSRKQKNTAPYRLSIGAKNIFNTQPDAHQYAGESGWLGADYPLNHPAGFNGALYYIKFSAEL